MTATRAHTPSADVVNGFLATSRLLVGLVARSLAELDEDVTLAQYRVLVILGGRGPQRTSDLAAELSLASSTVTRMCDRLYGKALVRRYRRSDDRRATWVMLSDSGRDLLAEIMRRRRASVARYVKAIPGADLPVVAAALRAFVDAADEIPEPEWSQRLRRASAPDPLAVEG